MSTATLHAALIALVASAAAVAAAPCLSLKVTGPDAVNGVENLKVVTALTNTSDETLKLLNDPNGILNPLPADTFTINTADGARPSFAGVRAKYSPSLAAQSGDPAAFTVLEPGATVSITHDISSAYNFTSTGHGTYTVQASNAFYAVDANDEVSTLSATPAEPHTATLTGGDLVAIRHHRAGLSARQDWGWGRASFSGCSDEQQTALAEAACDAHDYATAPRAYLDLPVDRLRLNAATPRYTTWFGAFDDARYDTFDYDCTCADAGTFAYVYPDEFGTVYRCGAFWKAPAVGTDSKAGPGTLVHEASHFIANGGTKDYAYGQADARALAQSDPEEAVFNADSYEYYAENDPAQG